MYFGAIGKGKVKSIKLLLIFVFSIIEDFEKIVGMEVEGLRVEGVGDGMEVEGFRVEGVRVGMEVEGFKVDGRAEGALDGRVERARDGMKSRVLKLMEQQH